MVYYNPDNHWVVGIALNRDFDDIYELLGSGKDLSFRWFADGGNKMVWFYIAANHGAKTKFLKNSEQLFSKRVGPWQADARHASDRRVEIECRCGYVCSRISNINFMNIPNPTTYARICRIEKSRVAGR